MTLLFIIYSLSICYIIYFTFSILSWLNKESKSGLINGTYHLQLSKEEILDMKGLIQLGLAIYREREPKSIYKDKVKRLENMEKLTSKKHD